MKRRSPTLHRSVEAGASTHEVPLVLPAAALMDELTKLGIYHECERLLSLYYYFENHGQCVKCVDLFTDDPVVKISPGLGVWKGKENLMNGMKLKDEAIREGTLLVLQYGNFLLTSLDKTEATGTALFTLYKSVGKPGQGVPGQGYVAKLEQPTVVGETRDRFVKTKDGWRIAEHEIIYVFDIDPDKRVREAYARFMKFAASAKK